MVINEALKSVLCFQRVEKQILQTDNCKVKSASGQQNREKGLCESGNCV